jgi:hypothetical protein
VRAKYYSRMAERLREATGVHAVDSNFAKRSRMLSLMRRQEEWKTKGNTVFNTHRWERSHLHAAGADLPSVDWRELGPSSRSSSRQSRGQPDSVSGWQPSWRCEGSLLSVSATLSQGHQAFVRAPPRYARMWARAAEDTSQFRQTEACVLGATLSPQKKQ